MFSRSKLNLHTLAGRAPKPHRGSGHPRENADRIWRVRRLSKQITT
jgi:hypothetical protein